MEMKREPIAVRLREGLLMANKKQADLVRETGLDRGSISSYLAGKYEPKQKAIYLIAKSLNVSEAWLLGFDVPMYRTDEQKKNDQLVELVDKIRGNEKFYSLVNKLGMLENEQLDLIDKLVDSLSQK